MSISIAVAGLAFLATLALTPFVRRCAIHLGIVDRPDAHRKLHRREIPLGGGVAVLCGLALTLGVALLVPSSARDTLMEHQHFLTGLALASFVICAVGLVDDRVGLRGRQKLAGQFAAAAILIAFGFTVEKLRFLSWEIELGLLAVPFTLLWLLGTINALNLIDGMDGLASGIGIVMSLAIGWASVLQGNGFDALLALLMAGSLLGFLYYNFSPAKMFLGDAGSMLVGLVLGTLAIRCSFSTEATAVICVPIALWAIPFFDVAMAILRRRLTGRSIFTTDRGHLHHCLLHRGYSCRVALLVIAMLCVCTAVGAVSSVALQHDLISVGLTLGVTGLMAATRFFGHAECSLLCRRIKAFAFSFLPIRNGTDDRSRQFCTHLQGMQRWDELWQTLTIYAEQFDLTAVQLNVNVPSIHEEYHASWNRKVSHDQARLCNTEIPLIARDRTVGRIKITVDPLQQNSMCGWMSELISGLKPFESLLLSLLAEPPQAGAVQDSPGSETSGLRPEIRWTPRAAEVYASASLAVAGVEMAPR